MCLPISTNFSSKIACGLLRAPTEATETKVFGGSIQPISQRRRKTNHVLWLSFRFTLRSPLHCSSTLMTSSNRVLEHLPLEIFEKLALEEDADPNSSVHDDDDDSPSLLAYCPSIALKQRLCNKLKSFSQRIGSRTKQKCIYNVGDFLRIPDIDLVYGLDPLLTFAECRELRRRICAFCTPKPVTVLSLFQQSFGVSASQQLSAVPSSNTQRRVVPSGIPALDMQLKGGFRVGSVTEIYGRAGTGKTQLAMQFCVAAAARQGLASAFIDTEGKFSLKRLEALAVAITAHQEGTVALGENSQRHNYGSRVLEQRVTETLSHFLYYSANDADQLRSVLSAVEVEACARCDTDDDGGEPNRKAPMGIIVLDSIASPARRDFGTGDATSRAKFLMECAKTLKRIAETLNLAVVVVNQMGGTAFQPEKGDPRDPTLVSAGALGNSWHHCSTTRLQIERKGPPDAANREHLREIVVTKSSSLMRGTSALVYLDQDGFKDVPLGFLQHG